MDIDSTIISYAVDRNIADS